MNKNRLCECSEAQSYPFGGKKQLAKILENNVKEGEILNQDGETSDVLLYMTVTGKTVRPGPGRCT